MLPSDNNTIDYIAEAFLESENRIEDLKIVPITINYERVYEGEAFPFELTGEDRVKETIQRVKKGFSALKKKYGRVFVNFAEPKSFRDYMKMQTPEGTN